MTRTTHDEPVTIDVDWTETPISAPLSWPHRYVRALGHPELPCDKCGGPFDSPQEWAIYTIDRRTGVTTEHERCWKGATSGSKQRRADRTRGRQDRGEPREGATASREGAPAPRASEADRLGRRSSSPLAWDDPGRFRQWTQWIFLTLRAEDFPSVTRVLGTGARLRKVTIFAIRYAVAVGDKGRNLYASEEYLADLMSATRKTVRRYLADAVAAGIFRQVRAPDKRKRLTGIYEIRPFWNDDQDEPSGQEPASMWAKTGHDVGKNQAVSTH